MMDRKNNNTGGTGAESARKKYITFISYTGDDFPIVSEIYKFLNAFRIPRKLRKAYRQNNLPQKLKTRIFFATDRADAGPLRENIKEALDASESVTVMCSPNAPKSKWVNDEIEMFAVSNDKSKIYPFIVSNPTGERDISKIYAQYYPKNLVRVLNNVYGEDKAKDFLAPNVDEVDAQTAAIKSIAYTLGVPFGELNEYYKREERQRRRLRYLILLAVIVVLSAFLSVIVHQYRKNQNNQSRAVAQAAERLIEEGDIYTAQRICIEALPKSFDWWRFWERPYVPEVERVLNDSFLELESDKAQSIAVLQGHTARVNYVAFSPDGEKIVSASDDMTIRIWSTKSGKELQVLTGHDDKVRCASFSPDGKKIISASSMGGIRLWDAETGEAIKIMDEHGAEFATFAPDGERIFSVEGSLIKIWDADSYELLKELSRKNSIYPSRTGQPITFSPDGAKFLLSDCDHVDIRDVETGEVVRTLTENTNYSRIYSASYSPDGKMIFAVVHAIESLRGGKVSFKINVWDSETGQVLKTWDTSNDAVAVLFNRDRIITASNNKIIFFDVDKGEERKSLQGHADYITSIAISQDKKRLASASNDYSVRIYKTEAERNMYSGSAKIYNTTSLMDDGTVISVKPDGHNINICNADTGEVLKTLTGHTDNIFSVYFNSKGDKIVSTSWDKTMRIWDAQSGKEIKSLVGTNSVFYTPWDNTRRIWYNDDERIEIETGHAGAVFNQMGNLIVSASSDNTIKIWDAQTGEEVKTLKGHKNEVQSAVFNSKGNRIVSSSLDNTIKIWNVRTGKVIKTITNFNFPVGDIAFFKKSMIIGAGIDGVKIWDIKTGRVKRVLSSYYGLQDGNITIDSFLSTLDLIDQTRERFKDRPLTDEEREQYYLL